MNTDLISDFVRYAAKELGLQKTPKVILTQNREEGMTTAYYSPSENLVKVYVKGRANVDVCRSTAHEMIHHRQNEQGQLRTGNPIPDIGGPIEDEANAVAGQLIKKFVKDTGRRELYNESVGRKPSRTGMYELQKLLLLTDTLLTEE